MSLDHNHNACVLAIEPCKRRILREIREAETTPWTVLSNGYTASENAHVFLLMNDSRKSKTKSDKPTTEEEKNNLEIPPSSSSEPHADPWPRNLCDQSLEGEHFGNKE